MTDVVRRFRLVRTADPSGVSGIGTVAEGCLFSTGKVTLAWTTTYRSVAVYDSMTDLEAIHGHAGATRVEWIDHDRAEHAPGDGLRERLAALAHVQWSEWMIYMFQRMHEDDAGRWIMGTADAARWHRQMRTPYDALPEDEKESDRKEADRVLALIGAGEAGED